MISLLFLLLTIIILILAWISYYKWLDSFIPSLKGPSVIPIIGIISSIGNPQSLFQTWMKLYAIYGKTFRKYFLKDLCIYTIDPELIEFTLNSPKTMEKGVAYKYFHRWLGTGLFTSGGDKWRQRRKLIAPAYHYKILEQFIEVFNNNASIMVKKLQDEVNKPQIDIVPYVNLCALDVICETAMGTKVNAQLCSNSQYVEAINVMRRIIMERRYNLLKLFDWSYRYTQDYKVENIALNHHHGFTRKVIQFKKQQLSQEVNKSKTEETTNLSDEEICAKERDSFMKVLLKSTIVGQPLTDEDIQEEVNTFMFGGHDTISSAVSFALYLISNYPDVQEKLIQEQKKIFGNNQHRQTTIADLQNMKYLELVLKETLRMYPSAPIIARRVTEDVTYKNMKFFKGTQIIICTYALHKDPQVFTKPGEFLPERFEQDTIKRRHPYAYIPFSAGLRNCIGQKFAQLEMKSTISKVIRNFELLPLVPKHEPFILSEIVLRSENGILLKLGNRKWQV